MGLRDKKGKTAPQDGTGRLSCRRRSFMHSFETLEGRQLLSAEVSISGTTMFEPTIGQTNASLYVSLSGDDSQRHADITVTYSTADGSAKAGTNYSGSSRATFTL